MSYDILPESYAAHISRYNLLTQEEECALGRIIQTRKTLPSESLSDEQRRSLEPKLTEIKSARDQLVNANLRLVLKIAYEHKRKKPGITNTALEDLIQSGNMALIRAANEYNPSTGYRFSTYAAKAIRGEMSAWIFANRAVKIPQHNSNIRRQLMRIVGNSLEENPLPWREITNKLNAKLNTRYEPKEVENLLAWYTSTESSLEGKNKDEDRAGTYPLEDTKSKHPEEEAAETEIKGLVTAVLKELPDRDRFVFSHRFGLSGLQERTLKEIGLAIGLSRERVRQLENKALENIRHRLKTNT